MKTLIRGFKRGVFFPSMLIYGAFGMLCQWVSELCLWMADNYRKELEKDQ